MTAITPASKEPRSPTAWSPLHKWSAYLTACCVCFMVGVNTTAILAAAEDVSDELHVNIESFDNSYWMVTAWNGGAALLPLVALPVAEDLGLKPIYMTAYTLFAIFVVVQAVAPNYATMIVSRFIAGCCGGILQDAVAGLATNIWSNDRKKRAVAISLYIFVLLGGVSFGNVFGGAVLKYLQWRWIIYIQLIILAALSPLALTLVSETELRSSQKRSTKDALHDISSNALGASRMFFTEFVISSFTIWSAFAFGTAFMLTQSVPMVYVDLYKWPAWQTGILQTAVFIGEIIGTLLCIFQDAIIFEKFSDRKKSTDKEKPEFNPEARLYTSIPASFLGLTAGLFVYGWTSDPTDQYPWPLPTLGLLLIGIGITVIVQAVTTYITDCYASKANTAVAAVGFGENVFAAFLPLATQPMYRKLGSPWASSLLGFIGLVVSFAPVVLVVFGEKIRARSRNVETK